MQMGSHSLLVVWQNRADLVQKTQNFFDSWNRAPAIKTVVRASCATGNLFSTRPFCGLSLFLAKSRTEPLGLVTHQRRQVGNKKRAAEEHNKLKQGQDKPKKNHVLGLCVYMHNIFAKIRLFIHCMDKVSRSRPEHTGRPDVIYRVEIMPSSPGKTHPRFMNASHSVENVSRWEK